jgi:hypothetical protein
MVPTGVRGSTSHREKALDKLRAILTATETGEDPLLLFLELKST